MLLTGCTETVNERLVRHVEEVEARAATERAEHAQLARQVAEAQRELIRLQQRLEADRAELARQRQHESFWGPMIEQTALLLGCLLPLLLAIRLLGQAKASQDDSAVVEAIVEELLSDEPGWIAIQAGPPSAALPDQTASQANP